MPSAADAVMNSDHDPEPIPGGRTTRVVNRRGAQPSSPRPSGPGSEINGALSDVEGFPDDEVVGARGTDRNRPRDPMAQAVPKVVDKVGEKVAEEFESFLDQYVCGKMSAGLERLIRPDLLKMSSPRERHHPVH